MEEDKNQDENVYGAQGQVEKSRKRVLTERGVQYAIETKGKHLRQTFNSLEKDFLLINFVMATGVSPDRVEDVRREYSAWLTLFNTLYVTRQELSELLDEQQLLKFKEDCAKQDKIFLNIKATVEQFFLSCGEVQHVQRAGSVGSRCSKASVASTVLSAQLKERQKQAELQAKTRILKERLQLEQEKLNIKMKEEEFELKAQLEISEAKSKVLDNFDTGEEIRSCDEENLDIQGENIIVDNRQSLSQGTPAVRNMYQRRSLGEEQGDRDNRELVSSSLYTVTEVARQLRKPTSSIQQFNGNPLDFERFKRQFKTKIVSNTDSEDELMCYLEQFTGGEAHQVVKGYSYLEARSGYRAAMAELQERYGDPDRIANALIKKALCWPNIKSDDVKALDDYSIFLNECQNAVRSLHAARVLEYPDNVRKLVMKLPFHCHERWRNIVMQIRQADSNIEFSDLVQFVRKEAKKATDPMYGKDAMRGEDQKRSTVKRGLTSTKAQSKQSFRTDLVQTNIVTSQQSGQQQCASVSGVQSSCGYCGSQRHGLGSCEKLAFKPHKERLDFLRAKGVCFRCFESGHCSKKCSKAVTCQHCKGSHATLLHMDKGVNLSCLSACTEGLKDGMEAGDNCGQCMLAVIPVKITFNDSLKVVSTYAFLDPGSTVSFCSQSLIDRLGCQGKAKKVEITIDTLGKPHTSCVHAVSGLKVHDLDLTNTVVLPTVYSRESIPVAQRHIPTMFDVERWPHLEGIYLSSLNANVDLLIGGNVPDAYSPMEIKTGPSGSPHATRTRLGWTLWNVIRPTTHKSRSESHPCMAADVISVNQCEDVQELNKLVAKSMNFDFPECMIDDKPEKSVEDNLFLEKVNKSISLQDGRYHINLPFKSTEIAMPNNATQAIKRLNSLKQRFSNNYQFKSDYTEFMNDIIDKGYAEKVPSAEVEGQPGKTWYIPHHGVYHSRKKDKIRVVFDCSASYEGVSLNTMLLQGPNLTNNLVSILIRFRQEPIAFMGDIESMYYRVKVAKEDCDYLRFYWWPNGDCEQKPSIYRMQVHLFGAISSSSCASFALQRTADDCQNKYNSKIVQMIRDNFYVDDCLASVASEEKAVTTIHELTQLCSEGGFRLTKWVSNSRKVMLEIPKEERAKNVKELNLEFESLPSERALGVFWFVESDCLSFKIQEKIRPSTRRGILSLVSSVYDPLGLAAPFVLVAKQLLQNLCKEEYGWDEPIDENSLKIWCQWLEDLPKLEFLSVNQCYKPQGFSVSECQLHLFSDASDVGYGVVAYIRLIDSTGAIHCSLVMAKSRVASLKKMTIPRMELTAATVAVRLCRLITKELQYNIKETYFWTDSMAVLRYISNTTARFKTFVANRLAVIHEGSQVNQWNYVSSKLNPADCASRGMLFDKFVKAAQWFDGPRFLWEAKDTWPISPDLDRTLSDEDQEMKRPVNMMLTSAPMDMLERLLNKYSSWERLKRAVGWLILFVRSLKRKVKDRIELKSPSDESEVHQKLQLNISVLKESELVLVRYVQGRYFNKELEALSSSNIGHVSKTSPLFKLDPFVENGIIRVGGRLKRAKLSHDVKHPIVLPKNSPLSSLIVEDVHKSVGHLGRNAILARLRQQFWILGAGSIIRSLMARCVTCLKYQAHVGEQQMSDLPQDRLQTDKPPFSHVGIDYFGPFLVKRGRSTVKRYGVVFSCLTMRAVHLEVACSLDTDSCINAIRRFVARRGPPELIRSDNGTNFTSSERELKEEITRLNQSKIHAFLLGKGIEWTFNPPSASHHGGAWERMIRSIRKVFSSVMHEQGVRLNDEELATLFCEVEMILNNRPITDVPYSPNDLNPLTPNHLLMLRSGESMPPGIFTKEDVYTRRRWRQVQYLSDLFWKRWLKEYLPLQQTRQKWLLKRRNLQVGDIVLLVDNTPRNSWSLARVTAVMMDKQGLVRVVRVKTATSELVRPIDKVCLIVASD